MNSTLGSVVPLAMFITFSKQLLVSLPCQTLNKLLCIIKHDTAWCIFTKILHLFLFTTDQNELTELNRATVAEGHPGYEVQLLRCCWKPRCTGALAVDQSEGPWPTDVQLGAAALPSLVISEPCNLGSAPSLPSRPWRGKGPSCQENGDTIYYKSKPTGAYMLNPRNLFDMSWHQFFASPMLKNESCITQDIVYSAWNRASCFKRMSTKMEFHLTINR